MFFRSFAKINLALAVLGRRPDGYHNIETVFQAIDLSDELDFRPSPEISLICEGLPDVSEKDNIVWKAASLLAERIGERRGAAITLRKKIPSGAGLGGGSGNAAAALLGLRRFWNSDVSDAELCAIASELGSDVPFFLMGGAALGKGRGEILAALPDFQPEHLAVVFPGISVSTASAYRALNLDLTSADSDHRIQRFLGLAENGSSWRAGIFNDFETAVLPAHPEITEAKSFLEKQGAISTLLSGSGSSVFGFFFSEESARAAAVAVNRANWRAFPAKTLTRAEYFHRMFGLHR
ncbi:MAG: 4-(cytidine 5'-diphospho)-2-C-methyl-D-erythritol kinase [Acidobacteriota bacterium]|jgi:4-diphosphocytidyl-2-C-methyl-D-erythritol kinase|nr:4-(cytidine 5'-diphospho)-2-C-methyl-D-erythritol kinase [Acidobacteriota bacterium]